MRIFLGANLAIRRTRREKHVMRSAVYVLGAALALGVAGTASAQTSPTPSTATTQATTYGTTVSHWLASGFVGSGFEASGDNPGVEVNSGGRVDYGGQAAYLWHGIVGPEFLFDWAPNFDVNSRFIPGDTNVLSYMVNAIGAYPFGADGQFVPYASGGFGAIQASADVLVSNGTTQSNQNSVWGSNIGGGLMAFATPRFGVRGDLRYYHASTQHDFSGTFPDQVTQAVVSGLTYWRATGGISFRW
jgi:Outer membrane protein beta-barrel domain